MTDLHKLIKEKFTSGNHILVERIMLTRQEYEAALAQTPQKPDAWMHVQGDYAEASIYEMDKHYLMQGWDQYPLYAAPPSKQEPAEYDAPALYKAKAEREKAEKQEPVAWLYDQNEDEWVTMDWQEVQNDATGRVTPLYTAPVSKPWVSLTDEAIANCGWCDLRFARSIEAALKELNHG